MERTISSEERIRRAEELYKQRKTYQNRGNVRVASSTVKVGANSNFSLYKKLILQIGICLLIYFIFFLIKNSNYIFSEDVIKKTQELLSQDINFEMLYQAGKEFYEKNIQGFLQNVTNISSDENIQTNGVVNETQENVQTNQIANEIQENAIQSNTAQENTVDNQQSQESQNTEAETGVGGEEVAEPVQISQMEIDANEIKEKYSFIIPLQGTITSTFGPREATEIVSANHGGIDIGADEGTTFVASMEGTVSYLSSEGDYGLHVWIQNGDVETLYAHCRNIYVQEGQQVKQGEIIGEVGSTGRATGPHLHFEIRKSQRRVDPEYILQF